MRVLFFLLFPCSLAISCPNCTLVPSDPKCAVVSRYTLANSTRLDMLSLCDGRARSNITGSLNGVCFFGPMVVSQSESCISFATFCDRELVVLFLFSMLKTFDLAKGTPNGGCCTSTPVCDAPSLAISGDLHFYFPESSINNSLSDARLVDKNDDTWSIRLTPLPSNLTSPIR